jgi:hypothetical protein
MNEDKEGKRANKKLKFTDKFNFQKKRDKLLNPLYNLLGFLSLLRLGRLLCLFAILEIGSPKRKIIPQ